MYLINTILVPQGAEYKAVCRGVRRFRGYQPQVIAIPIGMQALGEFLDLNCQYLNQRVLLMGLCGSLNQRYGVGDIVLYGDCVYQGNLQECNYTYIKDIQSQLEDQVYIVKGLTSDRLISLAAEKRSLHEKFAADVVDMEGFTALEFFQPRGVPVAMLRVVSDDSHHDIPDLALAIAPDGSLLPLPLATTLIRLPLAAIRLIRGSLQGLKVLENVTYRLLNT
jgi:hypothetical protein